MIYFPYEINIPNGKLLFMKQNKIANVQIRRKQILHYFCSDLKFKFYFQYYSKT